MSVDARYPGAMFPADFADEITPDDDNDLTHITRGIYVGTSGDLVVRLAGEDSGSKTFVGVMAGTVLPLRVKRVFESSTADNLLGLR